MSTVTMITNKTSTLAVKRKSFPTLGLEAPETGSDFLAMQPDLTLNPNFETADNTEMRGDIMASQKTVVGSNPSGSMSHYWKGSGTSGQAPGFSPFLESSFGRARELAADVAIIAGSNSGVIKIADADLPKFDKGDTVMISYADGSYDFRPIKFVGAGTPNKGLHLDFELDKVPAAGDKVKKFTTYAPTNANQPVVDVWRYYDGGLAGMDNISNCRVSSVDVTADAKAMINASYNFEGTHYSQNDSKYKLHRDAVKDTLLAISFGDRQFGFSYQTGTNTAGAGSIMLDSAVYTPDELAEHIQDKLRAFTATGNDFTAMRCSYDAATGKLSFGGAATGATKVNKIGITLAAGTDTTSPELKLILGYGTSNTDIALGAANALITATNKVQLSTYAPTFLPVYDDTKPVVANEQILYLDNKDALVDTPTASFNIATTVTRTNSVVRQGGNYGTLITGRSASMRLEAYLQLDDKRFFEKFETGSKINFFLAGGSKSEDGNWLPGQCYSIYGSEATIDEYDTTDQNDVFHLTMTLTCYSPGDKTGSIFCTFM